MSDAQTSRFQSLPLAPLAAPARRRLPLLSDVRASDREARPAVRRVGDHAALRPRVPPLRLARGPRAARRAQSTDEALDLVRQLADLGVPRGQLIGGEAYLRDDWPDIARAIRAAGMDCTMTTGGRGLTPERARAAKDAGMQSVSRLGRRAARPRTTRCAACTGAIASALAAIAEPARGGDARLGQHADQPRPSLRRDPDACFDALVAAGSTRGRCSSPCAMGRAADEPELLLEPYQLLEVMPHARALEGARATRQACASGRATTSATSARTRPLLRGDAPARAHGARAARGARRSASRPTATSRAARRCPRRDYVGGNVRDHSLARHLGARRAAALHARPHGRGPLGLLPDLLLRRRRAARGCSWTAHVLFGRPGNNPFCHHRALELLREGKRERLVRVQAAAGAVRPRPLRDRRGDWPAAELERGAQLAETGEGWLEG